MGLGSSQGSGSRDETPISAGTELPGIPTIPRTRIRTLSLLPAGAELPKIPRKIIESHSLLPGVAELPEIPRTRIGSQSLIPGGTELPEIPTIPRIRIQPHSLFLSRAGNAEIGSRIPPQSPSSSRLEKR